MVIKIKPSDIIERCLWDDYQKYVLDKSVNISELLEKNEEFEIKEEDAYVIGLLKCIETNNLVHRLNQHIHHLMSIRSINLENRYYMKKKVIEDYISDFRKKFPEEWTPSLYYKDAHSDVINYIDELLEKIDKLTIFEYSDHLGSYDILQCTHIKKTLRQHN